MAELEDKNRELVLQLMAALNVCDAARIREIIHPDAEWWVLGMGTMKREPLIAQLEAMLGDAKVAETEILGTTAEGERVCVEAKGNFEFADGRVYRNNYHHLFIIRDGVVIRVREYLDTALTARVFGTPA